MNEKQQQLTFDKGITNVPSDAICSDNTLEESVGMIYDDGEHRVIQKPKSVITGAVGKILYVHKYNDIDRYIHLVEAQDQSGQEIITVYDLKVSTDGVNVDWLTGLARTSRFYTPNITVTSTGKTLIVNEIGNPLTYYLWNDENGGHAYVNLGPLPDPKIEFWLEGGGEDFRPEPFPESYMSDSNDEKKDLEFYVYNAASSVGIIADNYMDDPEIDSVLQKGGQEDYNNLVIGLYAKNLKAVAEKKGFANPFFIRYALEMYDGSYTHISNPYLLMPCVTRNSASIFYENEILMTFTKYCKLHYDMESNGLQFFSDVVKNVVLFVSNGIDVYDRTVSQPLKTFFPEYSDTNYPLPLDPDFIDYTDAGLNAHFWCRLNPSDRSFVFFDGIYRKDSDTYASYHGDTSKWGSCTQLNPAFDPMFEGGKRYFIRMDTLRQKVNADDPTKQNSLIQDLKGASVFYKLCSIGLKSEAGDIADKIEEHVLENLTAQESLEEDDWFSRSLLAPNFMYVYNSRLNLANVSRHFFLGFDQFLSYDQSATELTYDIAVRIEGETRDYYIRKEGVSIKENIGFYFYYPDARAKHVWIRKIVNGTPTMVLNADLEEHGGLNGAFYLDKYLPGFNNHTTPTSPSVAVYPSSFDNDEAETLPNHIITSEVNNPWVFKAEGYNKVGTGKIIGMSTLTQALSQGQFGQYPLLVFSESGIWAMSVSNTGLFQAIHPMSREVCNNAGSITQTDGAVFFTSEKGLMVVVGSDVKCVSEQLSGLERNFTGEVSMGNIRDYMKDCFIAYDYRDSLLWIFNNSRQANNQYCYVYAIKTGTFGKYQFSSAIANVVNNYPDYLLQSGSTLFSLTGRQNINLDTDTYTGLMITRPMKLENGLALKSLMQIRHIKDMQGTMTMRIYASNNLTSWTELHSLRGMPWKYYRFRYDFAGMKATDRFTGTMLITQERRTDKLR